jgi:hypothetical protein
MLEDTSQQTLREDINIKMIEPEPETPKYLHHPTLHQHTPRKSDYSDHAAIPLLPQRDLHLRRHLHPRLVLLIDRGISKWLMILIVALLVTVVLPFFIYQTQQDN